MRYFDPHFVPSSLPWPGCTSIPPRGNSKYSITPTGFCWHEWGVHPNRKLYPNIPLQPNFLPIVCRGAPHQGLWPPLIPPTLTPQNWVHHINIGPHRGQYLDPGLGSDEGCLIVMSDNKDTSDMIFSMHQNHQCVRCKPVLRSELTSTQCNLS